MGTSWSLLLRVDRWARASHESAVDNARSAATELGRRRVERHEVELFLHEHRARPGGAARAPRPA